MSSITTPKPAAQASGDQKSGASPPQIVVSSGQVRNATLPDPSGLGASLDPNIVSKSRSNTWAADGKGGSTASVLSPNPSTTIMQSKKSGASGSSALKKKASNSSFEGSPALELSPSLSTKPPRLPSSNQQGTNNPTLQRKRSGLYKQQSHSSSNDAGSTINYQPKSPSGSIRRPPSGIPKETSTDDSNTGFLSSVLSAAGGALKLPTFPLYQKPKVELTGSDSNPGEAGGEEVIMTPEQACRTESSKGDDSKPAIDTIGAGNLSLFDLGIGNDDRHATSDHTANKHRYANSITFPPTAASHNGTGAGPDPPAPALTHRSRASTNTTTIKSVVPLPSGQDGWGVDKKLERGPTHRRTTSVTNSDSLAAAPLPGFQRQPTFAFAPVARNNAFHELFRSVPKDDRLIEDYSAALQREILLHGRLYISHSHICFFSNIMGWTTNLVISFKDIISVKKKWTAKIFPNGLIIETVHARNVFASLLSRDATFELITGIWGMHANLKPVENGFDLNQDVSLIESSAPDIAGDAESFSGSEGSHSESDDESDEVYDEDEDPSSELDGESQAANVVDNSATGTRNLLNSPETLLGSEPPQYSAEKAIQTAAMPKKDNGIGSTALGQAGGEAGATAAVADSSLGPQTHPPTQCGDTENHYDKSLIDTVIPASLGKVYSLMFGPESGKFMKNWLSVDQKCLDVQIEDDGRGLDEKQLEFNYSYIKPLYATIGPRQTKCIINSQLQQFDLNKAVSVLCSTTNPDVPSGKVFSVKTRYCLSWGPNGGTRLLVNYTVEWTGSSFIKGPIERNAHDGQIQYVKDLSAALTTAVAEKPVRSSKTGGSKRSRRKDGLAVDGVRKRADRSNRPGAGSVGPKESELAQSNMVMELLRPFLGDTVVSILELAVTPQSLLLILTGMVMMLYFRQRRLEVVLTGPSVSPDAVTPEGLELERTELWQWIKNRAGPGRDDDPLDMFLGTGPGGRADSGSEEELHLVPTDGERQKRLVNRLSDQMLSDAIERTRRRLAMLEGHRDKVSQKSGQEVVTELVIS